MALNTITVMGRLTSDPVIRHTPSGTPVASFTLAVDRDRKNENGDRETDFIPVVVWSKTAEFVSKYFGKGRMAVLEGRLQIRGWTDKDGNKRNTAEIVANSVYFGDSKQEKSADTGFGSLPHREEEQFTDIEDDDIGLPF